MYRKVVFGLALLIGMTLLGGSTYTTGEAAGHIGEKGTVCGTVEGSYYDRSLRGRPTFLNLDGRYPRQPFTVVIWGENRAAFGAPERRYPGREICVYGTIGVYRGTPQIVVRRPGQIRVR